MVVDVRKDENGTSSSVMLEEVEFSRALFELYEGGVVSNIWSFSECWAEVELQFMHQGVSYIVRSFPRLKLPISDLSRSRKYNMRAGLPGWLAEMLIT